jgi:hypothetical protein
MLPIPGSRRTTPSVGCIPLELRSGSHPSADAVAYSAPSRRPAQRKVLTNGRRRSRAVTSPGVGAGVQRDTIRQSCGVKGSAPRRAGVVNWPAVQIAPGASTARLDELFPDRLAAILQPPRGIHERGRPWRRRSGGSRLSTASAATGQACRRTPLPARDTRTLDTTPFMLPGCGTYFLA